MFSLSFWDVQITDEAYVCEAEIHVGHSHCFFIHQILPETSYGMPFQVKLGV
jgi:hypothetical protein